MKIAKGCIVSLLWGNTQKKSVTWFSLSLSAENEVKEDTYAGKILAKALDESVSDVGQETSFVYFGHPLC